ncbi:MAG: hypothetical protein DMD61_09345 [Gemmatimonadetes bacterium]|nr:MAG: hypothetical protein DMD61_09345 [Gemmatimonadota bacterium]
MGERPSWYRARLRFVCRLRGRGGDHGIGRCGVRRCQVRRCRTWRYRVGRCRIKRCQSRRRNDSHGVKRRRSVRFSLGAQWRRAADSVVFNIAEGASQSSRRQFRRYLEIANGSPDEIRCTV